MTKQAKQEALIQAFKALLKTESFGSQGEIVEALPPDQFFTKPAHERTKRFLEHVQ